MIVATVLEYPQCGDEHQAEFTGDLVHEGMGRDDPPEVGRIRDRQ